MPHAGVQPHDQWLPSSGVGKPLLPELASFNVVLACLCVGEGSASIRLQLFGSKDFSIRLGLYQLLAWPRLRFAGDHYDPTCRPGAPQNASHGCSQRILIIIPLSSFIYGPYLFGGIGNERETGE